MYEPQHMKTSVQAHVFFSISRYLSSCYYYVSGTDTAAGDVQMWL